MANDLAAMKARIADELARDDLTSQITLAISDAINFYKHERFEFNESRDLTFATVAQQEAYGSAANPAIATLRSFDYLLLYVGGILQGEIRRRQPLEIELANNSGNFYGQPRGFAFYNRQIRLSPIPDAVYTVRIAGRITYAAPASDAEAGNPWMIEAEALIRKRAKYELALNVTKDIEEAQRLAPQITEILDTLTGAANRLTGTGLVTPTQF
jgi:hypothetical protein